MWDEQTMQKLLDTYQEAPFEIIEKICQKNITPLAVYVHSPFCPSECQFCTYQGRLPLKGEREKYYNEYLPAQISNYKNILQTAEIDSWFFGGGTPSLMTPQILRNILSLLPGFRERGEKFFEIHPANFDLELLAVLQEYNFHNVIIGAQSFDATVLKKANRLPAGKAEIKNIIQEIQKHGMLAWLDLIGFINDDPAEITVLGSDIYTALELSPDEISLQPNFFLRAKYLTPVAELLETVFKTIKSNYVAELQDVSAPSIRQFLRNRKVVRLFNKKTAHLVKPKVNFMYALNTQPNSFVQQSFLGIGSYKNPRHGTTSCIVTDDYNYFFSEANSDWSPRYFILHTADFLEEALHLLQAFKAQAKQRRIQWKIEQLLLTSEYTRATDTLALGEDIPYCSLKIISAAFKTAQESVGPQNFPFQDFLRQFTAPPQKPFIDLSRLD
jgi:hypothetical protein